MKGGNSFGKSSETSVNFIALRRAISQKIRLIRFLLVCIYFELNIIFIQIMLCKIISGTNFNLQETGVHAERTEQP
jgi:hypothetical protein